MESSVRNASICLALSLALGIPGAFARKERLRHKLPVRQNATGEDKDAASPVAADSALFRLMLPGVTLSGYDRNYGKTSESFLVTNSNDGPVAGLEVEITYNDMEGRMLHRRRAVCAVDVPAGETRLVELRTPDRQGSMYYYKSKAPRKGGMPYRVGIRIVEILVMPSSEEE